MDNNSFKKQFSLALKAGQNRDYSKATAILEKLAACGVAEGFPSKESEAHPEVYLYLARSLHAQGLPDRAMANFRSYLGLVPEDPAGWFFYGRSCLAAGDSERAIRALRKSISLNPDSVDARALLGSACLRAKRPSLARSVFEEALSLAPDDERLNQGYRNALFVEAVRLLRKGEADLARQMFTYLINNDIDGVLPRVYLAHCLRDLGYYAEAIGQYEAAGEFSPDDPTLQWYIVAALFESGNAEAAYPLIESLGGFPGSDEPTGKDISLRIVRNHVDRGEWAPAARAGRLHIKKWGSDPLIHALMGEAQRNLGNFDGALNHFRKAVSLDKENPSARYGVLMLFAEQGAWTDLKAELPGAARAGCDPQFIAYYQALCDANLDENPETVLPGLQKLVLEQGPIPELISALARVYFRLSLPELAIGWYRKVLDGDPGNEEAFLGLIACCEELDSIDDLLESQRAYLETWPDNSAIRRDHADALASAGKWADAADQLELVASHEPSAESSRAIALYRRRAGQYGKAAIIYRNLLRARPDDRALLSCLLWCLDRMGETANAFALAHQANQAFAPDVESLLIEGRLQAKKGDAKGALEVFRIVVDKWPKDPRGWDEVASMYRILGVPEMETLHAEKARNIRLKDGRRGSSRK